MAHGDDALDERRSLSLAGPEVMHAFTARKISTDVALDDDSLFKSCCRGDEPRVVEWLAANSSVDCPNASGVTCLIAAATYGHVMCVELLLAAGAGGCRARGRSSASTPLICGGEACVRVSEPP